MYFDARNSGLSTEGEDGKTLSNLNKLTKITCIGINSDSIDLSKLEETVSRLNGIGDGSIFDINACGLICDRKNILDTLSKCTKITRLVLGMQRRGYYK